MSVVMVKLCDGAAVKSVSAIYKNCLSHNVFPNIWIKQSNMHHIPSNSFFNSVENIQTPFNKSVWFSIH